MRFPLLPLPSGSPISACGLPAKRSNPWGNACMPQIRERRSIISIRAEGRERIYMDGAARRRPARDECHHRH